ncbi:hypothetical protein K474DRAFT_1703759 [Panus rudis PR-1116 ss-1]|nr:hypothetical protein K474DRAFT_1703759 [Panus rudis PR-1116 ss-1]
MKRKFGKQDIVKNYLAMHRRNRQEIATIPAFAVQWIIRAIVRGRKRPVLDCLVKDVLRYYHRRDAWERPWILSKLLGLAQPHFRDDIHPRIFLRIVEHLHKSNELHLIPAHVYVFVMKAKFPHLGPNHRNKYMAIIAPHLIQRASSLLREFKATKHNKDPNLKTTRDHVMIPLLWYVAELVQKGAIGKALPLFKQMIEQDIIPERNLRSKRTMRHTIMQTLIATAMHYGWYPTAAEFALMLIGNGSKVTPFLETTASTMVSQIARGWGHYVGSPATPAIGRFIERALSRSPPVLIWDDVLQEWYRKAIYTAIYQAERVYDLTRSPNVMDRHRYAAPGKHAASWILQFSVNKSKNLRVARMLVDDVIADVNNKLDLAHYTRADIIAAAAVAGLPMQAKELWHRFSADPDRGHLILGSGSATIRLVSVFQSLVDHCDKMLSKYRRPDTHKESAHSPPSFEESTSSDDEKSAIGDILDAVINENRAQLLGNGKESDTTQTSITPTSLDNASIHSQTHAKVIAKLEERRREAQEFVHLVIAKFREVQTPLSKASRNTLNALARVYFITGQIMEGFRMFKILVARRELPDLRDVNVALSALSEYNPAIGSRMLDRMIDKGLKPDGVSYGTIIHAALLHDDHLLVRELILKARKSGVDLTEKTYGTLIRGTLSELYADSEDNRLQARRASALLRILEQSGYTPSVRIARDCVIAALRAGDTLMAFRIWRHYMRGKADPQKDQGLTRARLAEEIRKLLDRAKPEDDMSFGFVQDPKEDLRERQRKPITVAEAKAMLAELGENVEDE